LRTPPSRTACRRLDHRGRAGFTLVELLVVIGIIAVLVSILLPSLNNARRSARDVQCASNMRELANSMVMYAGENKGKYPPNINDLPGTPPPGNPDYVYWYDDDIIGPYLPKTVKTGTGSIGGPIFNCPEDEEGLRCYAMNIWASGAADQLIYNKTPDALRLLPLNYAASPPFRGRMFKQGQQGSSELILIGEKFPSNLALGGYFAGATVGYQGTTAGSRFGGNGGFTPAISGGTRYGNVRTEIDWTRHRRKGDGGTTAQDIKGRANFAFADGHVAMFRADELYDSATGKSNFKVLWSPWDKEIP
jgi:prepilin-type N-terminal cleavage/methylation domain-containing protein/prepilin-type processing-associated H-X9-DG protein